MIPFFLSLLSLILPGNNDDLPINRWQVIGSHNSYKQPIDPPLFRMIQQRDSATALALQYSHTSLTEQLDLGLRGLEIDVYADTAGGRYAHPKGLEWEGKNARPAPFDTAGVMHAPGFKVFHLPDIDFRSNCATLQIALQQLQQWSDAHPGHTPVFITMNAKDDSLKDNRFTVPEKFNASLLNQLDQEILRGLGRDKLILPEEVKGDYPTLEAAVLHHHWPALHKARGRFLFVLDEEGAKRAAYIQGHPSLQGRVLFTNSPAGTPEAAFMIRNEPLQDEDKIKELVKKGYLVRTRADADTKEARANDLSRFKAACSSGAQLITTDYYRPSSFFPSPYVVHFAQHLYCRQDPF